MTTRLRTCGRVPKSGGELGEVKKSINSAGSERAPDRVHVGKIPMARLLEVAEAAAIGAWLALEA